MPFLRKDNITLTILTLKKNVSQMLPIKVITKLPMLEMKREGFDFPFQFANLAKNV